MLDTRLRYLGEGKFQTTNLHDANAVQDALEAGDVVRAQITQPRTLNQNRLLHALCEAAWENHQGGPTTDQVPTWRHMKAWLLIEAGHYDVVTFDAGALSPAAMRHLRKQWDTVQFSVKRRSGEIVMKTRRETRNLGKEDMSVLIDRVMEIIGSKVVPGVDPMSLFEQAKQRAA